ncbi:hypothetical protein Bhyg_12403, partial [Pseudolycoriella hygida]
MGCPVKVRLSFNGTQLVVKEAQLHHENHLLNEQVYKYYPENLRLIDTEVAKAQEMIEVDANKKKVKMVLEKQRGKPVPIKLLHNLQTKINEEKQAGSEPIL